MRTYIVLAFVLALLAVMFAPAIAQLDEEEGTLDPMLGEDEVVEEIDTDSAPAGNAAPAMSAEEVEKVRFTTSAGRRDCWSPCTQTVSLRSIHRCRYAASDLKIEPSLTFTAF
jgi:hypothetical protein